MCDFELCHYVTCILTFTVLDRRGLPISIARTFRLILLWVSFVIQSLKQVYRTRVSVDCNLV